MNFLTQSWITDGRNITRENYVPCKICGVPTSFKGTKLCNGCYEVTTRLRSFLCCQNAMDFVSETLSDVTNNTIERLQQTCAELERRNAELEEWKEDAESAGLDRKESQ